MLGCNKTNPSQVVPPPPSPIIIGIHGSDTIGEELMPELIRHYLEDVEKLEFQEKHTPPPTGSQNSAYDRTYSFVKDGRPYSIELRCMTSGAGVKDLIAGSGSCVIAMSSAQNEEAEKQKFQPYMIAGDGLCFVLNNQNDNHIQNLLARQLQKIYSMGSNWSEYSGPKLQVVPFNHNAGSGTRKVFESKIQPDGKAVFYTGNQNLEESHKETLKKVADTPGAIGFVGLSSLRYMNQYTNLTKLRINGIEPTPSSIKSEDYLVTRRLFLYAQPESNQDPVTKSLIQYAQGNMGQAIVTSVGFADRMPGVSKSNLPALGSDAVPAYRQAYKEAKKLDSNIRFPSNRDARADIKGREDLPHIAQYLKDRSGEIQVVYVFGFADAHGTKEDNQRLSNERAASVAQELRKDLDKIYAPGSMPFTLVPMGCGATSPIVPNASTDQELEKNRRVEIWTKGKAG